MEENNHRRMTGDELKQMRLSLGYTQKEMAEQLATPLTTYRNWERFHARQIRSGTLRAAVEKAAGERRREIPENDLKTIAERAADRYEKQSGQRKAEKQKQE